MDISRTRCWLDNDNTEYGLVAYTLLRGLYMRLYQHIHITRMYSIAYWVSAGLPCVTHGWCSVRCRQVAQGHDVWQ
jgi:hypothetical protein